uniref:hypothetical protein n=1 Tax=Nonomuraea sp. CA-251285 TaxID=3240002 RepID=UPI003F49541E
MAITPATRVSQALQKGGLPTTFPGTRREGTKVRNACAPASLASTRQSGSFVVWVSADFDAPSLVQERVGQIMEILTAAGYRVERSLTPGSGIVNVWEPNWRSYLDPRLAVPDAADEPAPAPAPVWRADKMRDGLILFHTADCPAPPPGKSIRLQGRTLEDATAEVVGKLLPREWADAAARLVKTHDCLRPAGGPRDTA